MNYNSIVHSKNLAERLEEKSVAVSEDDQDDPLYWYNYLKNIGKRCQTAEMVVEAVNSFDIMSSNYAILSSNYAILELVAKKFLTYEVCKAAVDRNGVNLKYVPYKHRDEPMCMAAVKSSGEALEAVPSEILLSDKGYEICLTAVGNDMKGEALSYVPDCYFRRKKGKDLCENAVRTNGLAIEHVPRRFLTEELVRLSIEAPIPSVTYGKSVLQLIPERYLSKELVSRYVELHPKSLRDAPLNYVSRDLCCEMVKANPENLSYVPKDLLDRELVEDAIKACPTAILYAPEHMLTLGLCRDAMRKDSTISIKRLPVSFQEALETELCSEPFIKYEPIEIETPEPVVEGDVIVRNDGKACTYDLAVEDGSVDSVYYISDIHLEHQLRGISDNALPEVKRRIKSKVSELLETANVTQDSRALYDGMRGERRIPWQILLVGGDVADSIELEALFYEELSAPVSGWQGKIVAVLGNHELWDGDPYGLKPARPVDEIIADYKKAMPKRALSGNVTLLENELLVLYKGLRWEILDEESILAASAEELEEVCSNSAFILLGGVGFSGLNPRYNAKSGIYRAVISTEEDILRSRRFRAVYDKVLLSARMLRVVVLTHTQMENWSDDQYNPNWIYVSGHTHQNTISLRRDGVTVFEDNQVGYEPKPWHLKSFTLDARYYDPFESFSDGIHQITREQYVEFNRCRGITMQGMKHSGCLYALKSGGVYMFLLKSSNSLCLLEGGRLHRLDNEIDYYRDKLPEYVRKVRAAFAPYQKALSLVADEIRSFGGLGEVHGCIVDIDRFNHVYLNPFDGKVIPYFAWDMTKKLVFKNVKDLIKSSPLPPRKVGSDSLLDSFLSMEEEKRLPILSRDAGDRWEHACVPQVVLDRSMYKPSRIMRSIQYVFDNNVLRIWNEAILSLEESDIYRKLSDMRQLV